MRERRPAELRREIGYAIQQIGLFPHLTVADNIATVPRLLGWDKARIRARVDELLELVSLDPHETRDRYPAQLSGGQRQRVGVARALAVDPPLMLMDEPFGAIDPINRERLQNEFLRLQREIRKTIVFVTHDIDEAIKMGDRIAVMQKGGQLAQYAPPAELLMYPANRVRRGLRRRRPRAQAPRAPARARRRPLEGAAGARRARPSAEARAKLADSEVPYPLLIDDDGRPLGWLSERALAGERVTDELRSRAEPMLDIDDVLRDALSDLLRGGAVRPVVDERGAVVGVLSIDMLAPRAAHRPRRGPERRRRAVIPLRPGRDPRAHEDTLRVGQRLLPRLDRRQLRPLRRPVLAARLLTLVAVAIGFVIAFGAGAARPPAPLARSPRSRRSRASSTRSRASPSSSCCCRSPGAATRRRSSRSSPTRC